MFHSLSLALFSKTTAYNRGIGPLKKLQSVSPSVHFPFSPAGLLFDLLVEDDDIADAV